MQTAPFLINYTPGVYKLTSLDAHILKISNSKVTFRNIKVTSSMDWLSVTYTTVMVWLSQIGKIK